MTSNENIGKKVNNIFKKLMISEFVEDSTYMLIAPKCFQNRIIELIDNEINNAKDGKEAYIGIKINSLTDKLIIDKLIEASMANVKIELVIRGMPCNSNKSKGMVKDSLYKAISVKKIKEMIDEIYDLNIDGINILCHVIPERVYTIIPGMIAIKQICNYLGTKKIRLIDASVREGYLINSL